MTDDLFSDPDLFAPPPKRVRSKPPAPKPAPVTKVVLSFIGPRWPVASMACDCGAREEIKEPAPDRLDCFHCRGLETMIRRPPRFLPPPTAGRDLTALERRGLELDGVGNP